MVSSSSDGDRKEEKKTAKKKRDKEKKIDWFVIENELWERAEPKRALKELHTEVKKALTIVRENSGADAMLLIEPSLLTTNVPRCVTKLLRRDQLSPEFKDQRVNSCLADVALLAAFWCGKVTQKAPEMLLLLSRICAPQIPYWASSRPGQGDHIADLRRKAGAKRSSSATDVASALQTANAGSASSNHSRRNSETVSLPVGSASAPVASTVSTTPASSSRREGGGRQKQKSNSKSSHDDATENRTESQSDVDNTPQNSDSSEADEELSRSGHDDHLNAEDQSGSSSEAVNVGKKQLADYAENARNTAVAPTAVRGLCARRTYAHLPRDDKSTSVYFTEFLDAFGEQGGFQALVDCIFADPPANKSAPADGKGPAVFASAKAGLWPPLLVVNKTLVPFVNARGFLAKDFAEEVITLLRIRVFDLLMKYSIHNLAREEKVLFPQIGSQVQQLLSTIHSEKTVARLVEDFNCGLALKSFRSEALSQRLNGIKFIRKMVQRTEVSATKTAISSWLSGAGSSSGSSVLDGGLTSRSKAVADAAKNSATQSSPKKSVSGPKSISNVVKTAKSLAGGGNTSSEGQPHLQPLSASFLLKWLEEHQIVEDMLHLSAHDAVFQQGQPILKFLAQHEKLSQTHVLALWNAAVGRQETEKRTIYQCLMELAPMLSGKIVAILFDRMQESLTLRDFDRETLAFVRNLTPIALDNERGDASGKGHRRTYGLELLWDVLMRASAERLSARHGMQKDSIKPEIPNSDSEDDDSDLRNHDQHLLVSVDIGLTGSEDARLSAAIHEFGALLRSPQCSSYRQPYVERCLAVLRTSEQAFTKSRTSKKKHSKDYCDLFYDDKVPFTSKLFQEILLTFSDSATKLSLRKKGVGAQIEQLVEKDNLLALLVAELESCLKVAAKLSDTSSIQFAATSLEARFGFLRFILSQSSMRLGDEEMKLIWEAACHCPSNLRNFAFSWFTSTMKPDSNANEEGRRSILEGHAADAFFARIVAFVLASDVAVLELALWKLFVHSFLESNLRHGHLRKSGLNTKAEISVVSSRLTEIPGFDALWHFVLYSTDAAVRVDSSQLLAGLFLDPLASFDAGSWFAFKSSSHLDRSKVAEARVVFLQDAVERLRSLKKSKKAIRLANLKAALQILYLLRGFITSFDMRQTVRPTKSASALDMARTLVPLNVKNDNGPPFTLHMHQGHPLKLLFYKIAEAYGQPVYSFVLFMDDTRIEVTDSSRSKSLKDLAIISDNTVQQYMQLLEQHDASAVSIPGKIPVPLFVRRKRNEEVTEETAFDEKPREALVTQGAYISMRAVGLRGLLPLEAMVEASLAPESVDSVDAPTTADQSLPRTVLASKDCFSTIVDFLEVSASSDDPIVSDVASAAWNLISVLPVPDKNVEELRSLIVRSNDRVLKRKQREQHLATGFADAKPFQIELALRALDELVAANIASSEDSEENILVLFTRAGGLSVLFRLLERQPALSTSALARLLPLLCRLSLVSNSQPVSFDFHSSFSQILMPRSKDVPNLLTHLMNVTSTHCLNWPSDPSLAADHGRVVTNALNLIVPLTVAHPAACSNLLLESGYRVVDHDSSDRRSSSCLSSASIFWRAVLLVAPDDAVRQHASSAVAFLGSVDSGALGSELVELLLSLLPDVSSQYAEVCDQYFTVLGTLLRGYQAGEDDHLLSVASLTLSTEVDDADGATRSPASWSTVLTGVLSLIKNRPVLESAGIDERAGGALHHDVFQSTSENLAELGKPDRVLIGLLDFARNLLRRFPVLKLVCTSGGNHLIYDVFMMCLFATPSSDPDAPRLPKCKTRRSRDAAVRLLIEAVSPSLQRTDVSSSNDAHGLAAGEDINGFEELLGMVHTQIVDMQAPVEWAYKPSEREKPTHGFVGLRNLGATCYMNSMLQTLNMMPRLRRGILAVDVEGTFDIDSASDEILAKELAKNLNDSESIDVIGNTQGIDPPAASRTASAEILDESAPRDASATGTIEGDRARVLTDADRHEARIGALKFLRQESVLYQLQRLFSQLQEGAPRWIDTQAFTGSITDFEGRKINPGVQMDSNEFSHMLFDKLEASLAGTEQATLLADVLQGYNVSQLIPSGCSHVSERDEAFFALTAGLHSARPSLRECMQAGVVGETLKGDNQYRCDTCDTKRDTLKRTCVRFLPDTLLIHLKRFEFDYERMVHVKSNHYCEFPWDEQLDMWPYTAEALSGMSQSQAPHPREYYVYELAGIVVHTGTVNSGHYYSFIRERESDDGALGGSRSALEDPDACRARLQKRRWFEFNDTRVTRFDPAEISSNCFGGTYLAKEFDRASGKTHDVERFKMYSAYILCYERIAQHGKFTYNLSKAESFGLHMSNTVTSEGDTNIAMSTDLVASSQLGGVPLRKAVLEEIWKSNEVFWRQSNLFASDFSTFAWGLFSSAAGSIGLDVRSKPHLTLSPPQSRRAVLATRFTKSRTVNRSKLLAYRLDRAV